MKGERNPQTLKDITRETEYDVSSGYRAFRRKDGYQPTIVGVNAIKPCGCEGVYLGAIITANMKKAKMVSSWKPPRNFRPRHLGYDLVRETKDRVALYRYGLRLFGKRFYGSDDTKKTVKLLNDLFTQMAWRHHFHVESEARRPRYPDAIIHKTIEDAMKMRPRQKCKLWGLEPETGRYRSNRKPIGYVWGKEAAAMALLNYHADRNEERRREEEHARRRRMAQAV